MKENSSQIQEKNDPKIINCFKQAVVASLGSICGIEPNFHENLETNEENDAVIGMISLLGDCKTWSFMLGIPRETVSHLVLKFAGFEIDFDSPDMGDVVGELANIVAGDIASRLSNIGVKANLSLPVVTRGKSVEILKVDSLSYLKLCFSLPYGQFWIYIISGTIEKLNIKRS